MSLDTIAESIGTVEYDQESDDGNRLVDDEPEVEHEQSSDADMWDPRG